MKSFFKLEETYQLETEKSIPAIISTLKIIIELNKGKKGVSALFKYPDFSSINVNQNTIYIHNVVSDKYRQSPIGEIKVSLFPKAIGTKVIAQMHPYKPPVSMILAGFLFCLFLWFLLCFNHTIELPINEFVLGTSGIILLFFTLFFIYPIIIKKSMKSYLENVFFPLHLDGDFILEDKNV